MAKVDFYVLKASGDIARQSFACRLAEKAYRLNNSVHILTPDSQTASRIDDLLWTFRDGSFVPHELGDDNSSAHGSPVTINHSDVSGGDADLLINLSNSVPESASSHPRIAEIVSSDAECKQVSRSRFVEYREAGHTLETHLL